MNKNGIIIWREWGGSGIIDSDIGRRYAKKWSVALGVYIGRLHLSFHEKDEKFGRVAVFNN